MIDQLLLDSALAPEAFAWNGPISNDAIAAWEHEVGVTFPEDLRRLWSVQGGGELFETETLLSPVPDLFGEDVKSVTLVHRNRGLPDNLFLFHYGLGFGAVRTTDGRILLLDSRYRVKEEFDSVGDWYRRHLREEYAERYGLDRNSQDASS